MNPIRAQTGQTTQPLKGPFVDGLPRIPRLVYLFILMRKVISLIYEITKEGIVLGTKGVTQYFSNWSKEIKD